MCERTLGIHRTYPDDMKNLWVETSNWTNVSQSRGGSCDDSFRYEDDGGCLYVSCAVDDIYLQHDNVQPCDSFNTTKSSMYCGGQGC